MPHCVSLTGIKKTHFTMILNTLPSRFLIAVLLMLLPSSFTLTDHRQIFFSALSEVAPFRKRNVSLGLMAPSASTKAIQLKVSSLA